MNHGEHKRGTFSGKIGFVLSAAGASVGLGNIWRFPYLAAKYGGGIFLLIYIILAMTFGYTMIVAETSIGRMTGKSPVGAYKSFGNQTGSALRRLDQRHHPDSDRPLLLRHRRLGHQISGGIPCWAMAHLVADGRLFLRALFPTVFPRSSAFWSFTAMTAGHYLSQVCDNGIERVSKFMMPILVVLSLIISVYSVTRPGALEGVKYFLVPNLKNFSWMTVVAAMGQMFYSLSIAMGILITFGSYMKKDVSIEESTRNVEIFDTAIAIMAGLMIIPAVFAFSGGDPGCPEGRSGADVHHHSQGFRFHGPGHRHRHCRSSCWCCSPR